MPNTEYNSNRKGHMSITKAVSTGNMIKNIKTVSVGIPNVSVRKRGE